MPYPDKPRRLGQWLHVKGISRRISSTYSAAGYIQVVVDSVLPFEWVANIANRWTTPILVSRHRVSRFRWRWVYTSDVPSAFWGTPIKRGREYEDGPIHYANDGCTDHA